MRERGSRRGTAARLQKVAQDDAGRGRSDEGMDKSSGPWPSLCYTGRTVLYVPQPKPVWVSTAPFTLRLLPGQKGLLLQGFGGFGTCGFPLQREFRRDELRSRGVGGL